MILSLREFLVPRFLGFCRLSCYGRRVFACYLKFRFLTFCRVLLLIRRVKQNLLPKNFAVIRCFFVCLSSVRRLFCDIWWLDFCSWFWFCLLLVLSVRCCFCRVRSPCGSFLLFFSLLLAPLLLGVGRGGGLFPCSAPFRGALRPRCRRCRHVLAHGCTRSLPPFLLLAVLPPFPLVAAGLLSFPPSPSLSFLPSSSVFLSASLFFCRSSFLCLFGLL